MYNTLIMRGGKIPCPPTKHFKTPQTSLFGGFLLSKTLQKSKNPALFSKISRK